MGRYTSQNMPMFSPWPEIWQLLSNIESLEGLPPTSFCSQYNNLLSPMLNSSSRKLNNTDLNLQSWYLALHGNKHLHYQIRGGGQEQRRPDLILWRNSFLL